MYTDEAVDIYDILGKINMRLHYLEVSAEQETIIVKRKKIDENAIFPTQAHDGDAGWDIYCLEDIELLPLVPLKIRTGIALQPPMGYRVTIHDKSGWGARGFHILGGLIEHTYTGEYFVVLINLSPTTSLKVKAGTNITQIVYTKVPKVYHSDSEFEETERADKGFGSSSK